MRIQALFLSLPLLAQAPQSPALPSASTLIQNTRSTLEARIQAYRAHVAAGKPRSQFHWNFAKELAAIETALPKAVAPEIRHALLVSRLGYRVVGHQKVSPSDFEAVRVAVPATSPAWSLQPSLLTDLAENLADTKAASAYLAEARANSPVADVRAYLLEQQFEEALEAKDEPVWKSALATLEKDHAGSKDLASAQRSFAEWKKTAVGVAAPAFSVVSLENPQTTFTLDTFTGSYVLIDFWATWCPYCVMELPGIHKAWAKFKDRKFQILSLSFDQKPEDIAPFRKKPATPMPWHHAFVAGAKKSALAEAYGVVGIPKTVLVGPDGRIVATDGELKGEQLEKTLERFLAR